jgi:hypothetical protein
MYGIETIKRLNERIVIEQVRGKKEEEKPANIPILSGAEPQEIRQVVAQAKNAEAEAARAEYDERLCSSRSEAAWALKSLVDKCRPLKEYRDAKYVGHKRGNTILILPAGKAIGFGFAGHASGVAVDCLGYCLETDDPTTIKEMSLQVHDG